jgi:hypothetical protein
MSTSWADAVWAALLAACAAGVVVAALRSRAPGWLLLLLACLPVAAILCKDDVRIFSYHGFMHTSVVYSILAGGLPPTDPFLAGDATRYAWAQHALVAGLSRGLDLAPTTVFGLLNVLLLALTVLSLDRAAALVTGSRTARILSVVLALYGISAFSRGPLWHALHAAVGFGTVTRILPVEKFAHVNNNAAGVLCFALYLYAAMRIWGPGDGRRSVPFLLLFAAVLGAALLYPLSWLPLAASAAACGGILFLKAPGSRVRTLLAFAGVVLLASLLALPYLLQIQTGRSTATSLGLTVSGFQGVRKVVTVAATLLMIATVSWTQRGELRRLALAVPERVLVLCVSTVVNLALYVTTHLPTHTEYKFLLVASISAGLLAGPALAALQRRRPALGFAVLWLVLLPAATHGVELYRTPFGRPGLLVVDGPLLRETHPIRNALNDWIREETPADAVFVDSELAIPVFAHRSLFALLDRPLLPLPGGDTLHGWSLPPSLFVHGSFGHPEEVIRRRYEITLRLLSPRARAADTEDLADLRRQSGTDHVYLVVRDPRHQKTPPPGSPFEPVFEAGEIRVYRLLPSQAPAGRDAA